MSTIQSGPAVIVDTGVVTAFMGFPIRISIEVEGTLFAVQFTFVSDPNIVGVNVASTFEDGCLFLSCANFDSAEGRGSSRPVFMGQTEDRAIFLHFKAFRYGKTVDHTVQYTFFSANKSAIGFEPA